MCVGILMDKIWYWKYNEYGYSVKIKWCGYSICIMIKKYVVFLKNIIYKINCKYKNKNI